MERWDPWEQLDRSPVDVAVQPLRDERGRWIRGRDRDQILLDHRLDRRTRREVLAHELVHAERGIGWPGATAATMELEEERVWRIALRRLAPPDQLAEFVRRRVTVGPVTVADVAEEFDLSVEGASRALAVLAATHPAPSAADDP